MTKKTNDFISIVLKVGAELLINNAPIAIDRPADAINPAEAGFNPNNILFDTSSPLYL
jgi:hypothetical protein